VDIKLNVRQPSATKLILIKLLLLLERLCADTQSSILF